MGRILRVLGVMLAAGLVVALIHPQLLFSELIFGRGDAFIYFTPLWALRDSALRAGELPLWTSRLFMGAPLLSDPQLGVFYPPNWLTVGLPAPYALKIATWLHLAWALAGAYLHLLRRFDNRMAEVATHLLISLSYCYRRCAEARYLAAFQQPLPPEALTARGASVSIAGPWRRFRMVRVPVQLCFDFEHDVGLFERT